MENNDTDMRPITRRFLLLLRSLSTLVCAFAFGAFCGWLTYVVMGESGAAPMLSGLATAAGMFLFLALVWVVTGKDPLYLIFGEN